MPRLFPVAFALLLASNHSLLADLVATTKAIQALPAAVLPEEQRASAKSMVGDNLRRRLKEANAKSSAEWKSLGSKEDWERFRKEKLALLKAFFRASALREGGYTPPFVR